MFGECRQMAIDYNKRTNVYRTFVYFCFKPIVVVIIICRKNVNAQTLFHRRKGSERREQEETVFIHSKCTDELERQLHLKVEISKIASILRKRFPVLITLRGRCLRDTFLLTSFRINELALDKVIYVPRPINDKYSSSG